jgi:hypothetical protein
MMHGVGSMDELCPDIERATQGSVVAV